ncbi:MAG TPA: TetR/AcrR family transcriptional regulator [Terriglobales bacterium]|nr:TetR/AcrR family transcriptional regulator [Terriglobales bacterium]
MARPRLFDEEQVLDAAGAAFWARGYEATSTRDLSAVTGLTASSLYAAFGDKQTLFRRAFDRYLDQTLHERMTRLAALPAPALAITTFFHEMIERSLADPQHRGCLLVNSAAGAAPEDTELKETVADELKRIEHFFRDRFSAGQAAGEIAATHDAADAAANLLAVLMGIRVFARARPERNLLTAAVRPMLAAFGLPPLP